MKLRQRKYEGSPQAKIFLTSFVSHKQNVNRIVSEIEIDLIFDFLCYSDKQNINGKVSEIEIGSAKESPPQAENFLTSFLTVTNKTLSLMESLVRHLSN